MEYIEREAALAFPFANGRYDHKNADPHFINGCETYKEWLETIPAADVVPVRHGRWIEREDMYYGWNIWECSACREEFCVEDGTPEDNEYNYCPNCGALMDKDGDGE